MILLTPEQAAEEFGIARRTVAYWVEDHKIRAYDRDDNERPQGGGAPGYRVARHEVAERVRKMPRRGVRRSPSPGSPEPQPGPHPTSPPHPGGD
ncbi:MerR-like helix-turn-helix DNA binding domain protein [Microbacterium phage DelaGarza]|nr:MerR-like helix-turn-helix DNA binding domain protein [Microbacterium phage DelaGarza]